MPRHRLAKGTAVRKPQAAELTIRLSAKDRRIVAECGDTVVEHGGLHEVLNRLILRLAAEEDPGLLALLAKRAGRENE